MMEKIWRGFGENTHRLEKNAKMLEKINTIIGLVRVLKFGLKSSLSFDCCQTAESLSVFTETITKPKPVVPF